MRRSAPGSGTVLAGAPVLNNRITRIRVQGLRTLADVTLDLGGLTVLIGDNGSGKSSLIEAWEILRRAAGENFADELQQIHGGAAGLFRFGATQLKLTVRVDAELWPLEYSFVIRDGGFIDFERLDIVYPEDDPEDPRSHPGPVLDRNGQRWGDEGFRSSRPRPGVRRRRPRRGDVHAGQQARRPADERSRQPRPELPPRHPPDCSARSDSVDVILASAKSLDQSTPRNAPPMCSI